MAGEKQKQRRMTIERHRFIQFEDEQTQLASEICIQSQEFSHFYSRVFLAACDELRRRPDEALLRTYSTLAGQRNGSS